MSSKGLDAIFGIDTAFNRTVAGWASLIHPADRKAMVAYFADEVVGRGRPFDRPYRIVRADTGQTRWVHGRGALELDGSGRPVRMFGTIADVTDQREAHEALIASERRYATIFEGATQAILIVEVETKRFRWVNSSACTLFGFTRDRLLQLTVEDVHPTLDLPAVSDQRQAPGNGRFAVSRLVPCRRKDGTTLLADISRSTAVVDGMACTIEFITDVSELRRLAAQDRKLAQAIDQAGEAIVITGETGMVEYANPAFERLSGLRSDAFFGGDASVFGSLQLMPATEAMERTVSAGDPWSGDLVVLQRDGRERVAQTSISPVRDIDGAITGRVTIVRDVTDERALADERERLVAAVEQTSDSVVIVDLAGTIEYVNPAFERVSGYRRDEAVGQNPRILKSGRQSAAFYRALWRRLVRGETWAGTLMNQRKDGSLYEEEATISPIRGAGGDVTGYVAVNHDVTALRAAESGLSRALREHAQVAAAVARLQPCSTPEETAADICNELLGLPGIGGAMVVAFLDSKRAVPLAVSGPDGIPMAPGRPLPASRAAYLYERAAQGPWAEAWQARHEDGTYGQMMADLGILSAAYAPIRHRDNLVGIIAVATRDDAYSGHLLEQLPAVGEFAAAAGALLGGQLERGYRDDRVREHVRRALAEGGLRPVFQPIVAIASGEAVGYEALTRFADDTPPERMFVDAYSVGLGRDLEVACLAAALEAAVTLPQGAWLGLNASPDLILDPTELATLLSGASRPFVIEVTERVEINDYAAVRAAIAGLGPRVRLAVDDAGAGFASLRHVVELAPQFLKLDISLVHQVDRDLARQAMIAGLIHFAARVGCDVIAEGIEEPDELKMLRELGVPFGQGHLLGRPESSRPSDPSAGLAERQRLTGRRSGYVPGSRLGTTRRPDARPA